MTYDLDSTTVRGAVVGGGLVMTRRGRTTVLHTATTTGPALLGEFADVREAWAAVDALDLEDVAAQAA
ncbi:hypothetical protein [Conexibacter sp. SYSU D00693]|uniref:hypothetical protein n=1 Tax=Conexibacter sp. SYSU D00693 TaxID=2812560 RepID=UPI00196B231F|nr:hypothetical protein [Conexibacter sp. SYSU D00693]